MQEQKKGAVSFGAVVATFGAVLIGLGIAWMVALNWSDIPSALKVLILVGSTAAAYAAGVVLRTQSYAKIGEALLLLGSILYILSIQLIAQIFNLSTSAQSQANLALLAWVGIGVAAYVFTSPVSLVVTLLEFWQWIITQYMALYTLDYFDLSMGIVTVIYLLVGIGMYGLTQIHKSTNHPFVPVYRYWTALYILILTYILSFQAFLPMLWPEGFSLSNRGLLFLLVLGIPSIILAMIGISKATGRQKLSQKEVFGFVSLSLLYIVLICLASLVTSGNSYGFFGGYGQSMSPGFWALWLFDNALFILVILGVIGYGTRYKSSQIINLGIMFFALDIITRYIGFALDFGGQLGFAFMSIVGGIILIFGGLFIERWRRSILRQMRT